jgi:hypothetical protein
MTIELLFYMIFAILLAFMEITVDSYNHTPFSCRNITPTFPDSPLSQHSPVPAFGQPSLLGPHMGHSSRSQKSNAGGQFHRNLARVRHAGISLAQWLARDRVGRRRLPKSLEYRSKVPVTPQDQAKAEVCGGRRGPSSPRGFPSFLCGGCDGAHVGPGLRPADVDCPAARAVAGKRSCPCPP